MMMYKILIVFFVICLFAALFSSMPRKLKLSNYNSQFKKDEVFKKINKVLLKISFLNKTKEEYISKLQLTNYKSYEYNNELFLRYIVVDAAISLSILIILLRVITMYYIAIIISMALFYLVILLGEKVLDYIVTKIHRQFPVALQCFLNEYVINKNIKDAINNSYYKMPKKIGRAFEMLARELSGGQKYEDAIKKFACKFSYVWGHSFAEILIMSYEGSGDITEDLMTLNRLVSEEITDEEEEKSSKFANKLTFIIVYVVALVGIIINIVKNDLSVYLYFYTDTGNTLIAAWLLALIIRVVYTSLSERER